MPWDIMYQPFGVITTNETIAKSISKRLCELRGFFLFGTCGLYNQYQTGVQLSGGTD